MQFEISTTYPLGSCSTSLRFSRACKALRATLEDPRQYLDGLVPLRYRPPKIFVKAPTPAGDRIYKCLATEAIKNKNNFY